METERMEGYTVLQALGKGTFGTVYKVQRVADGRVFAAKAVAYGSMSDKEKQMLVSEVNILREFRHPNIVRYYDRIIDRERKIIYIVMEFCENGDLGAYIKKTKKEGGYIAEEVIWRVFSQILLALKECHGKEDSNVILHRDLKPANIFLDGQRNVKLGDFGLARILSKSSMYAHTNVGTPYYMSPEQVNDRAYNEKSDIWSLGCLIYEIAVLAPPFEASNQIALAMRIRAGTFRDLPSTRYSAELNKVVRSMLQVEQHKRPVVDDLLQNAQIQLYLRERKISDRFLALKKKEEELDAREQSLNSREQEIAKREKVLGIVSAPLAPRDTNIPVTASFDKLNIDAGKENAVLSM
eukprot:ANDGO_01701.mRNA.1 putative serine/threonine-protein kinase nek2